MLSRKELAFGLAGLHVADLVATRVLPGLGDEHFDHLGVPHWLRPWLPLTKGAAVVALVATAKRQTLRSAVGAGLVSYYASAVTFHVLSGDSAADTAPAAVFGAVAATLV